MKLQYTRAYTSFFESPNWAMNLLWSGLAAAVPYVGRIVLYGWFGEILKCRIERPDQPAPDFDVHKLGQYVSRGLWPFLVELVVELLLVVVIVPVVGCCVGAPVALAITYEAPLWLVLVVLMPIAVGLIWIGSQVVVLPMVLRSSLEQDFVTAFKWKDLRRFIGLVRNELLLVLLFLALAGFVLGLVGGAVLIVGGLVAYVLGLYAYYDLMRQLYLLYLERGGEPIPVKSPPEIFGPPVPSLAEEAEQRSPSATDAPPQRT
jgi:hypothetical protein